MADVTKMFATDASGKTWDSISLAEYCKRSQSYGRQQLNNIKNGLKTIDQVLAENKNNKRVVRKNYKDLLLEGKLIDPETGEPFQYSLAMLVSRAKLQDNTARARLKKFMEGKIDEAKMLSNSKRQRIDEFRPIAEELTPEQKETMAAFRKIEAGQMSYHELMR